MNAVQALWRLRGARVAAVTFVLTPHEASSAPKTPVYHQRQPEHGTPYEVVRDNLQTHYAAIEHGFASPLSAFVRDESISHCQRSAAIVPPARDDAPCDVPLRTQKGHTLTFALLHSQVRAH